MPSAKADRPESTVLLELDAILGKFRAQHNLTSAEYYNALARMLAHHSDVLVKMERGQKRGPQ